MTKQKFIKLFQEYIDTLDDTEKDEYYCTEASFAQSVLDDFEEWLEKRDDI